MFQNLTKMVLVFSLFSIFTFSVIIAYSEADPINTIVNLPGAPLKILTYKAEYSHESKYSTAGILHKAEVQNVSDQEIVAYSLLFVSFDYFNSFLGKMGGFSDDSVKIKETSSVGWRSNPYGAFSFLTGVAFVDKVRFLDGKIWEANPEQILAELQKIEKSFDASILQEKEKDDTK